MIPRCPRCKGTMLRTYKTEPLGCIACGYEEMTEQEVAWYVEMAAEREEMSKGRMQKTLGVRL
jgi:DNA-directed RNA polymerase subunit M/transcription elongation factor TFIIS